MGIKKPAPPATLEADGVKVWKSIVSVYDLRPDELLTLEDICILSDDLAETKTRWVAAGKPAHTKGSMGQLTRHPDKVEIKANIAARNALWRQLKLPDLPVVGAGADTGQESGTAKPNQHRSAAQSKWAAAHGKGA